MIALARHLADSTAFALVVGLLCFCVRRRGPAARHTLWLIAVAKFVLPMAVFSWLGESLRELLPQAHTSANVPAALSRWVISPAISEPSNAATPTSFHPLIFIWLAGTALALALWLPKLWGSWHASDCAAESEKAVFSRLKKLIGVRRDVQLRFSNTVPEPGLAGFWKPVVIVPTPLTRQLSDAELESVILHELAHARRWDNWAAAFAHVVSCIFWFYPLLWWIERRLRRERELACDEMVIRCGAAPDDYVAGILKVCRFHLNEDVAGVSAVCGSSLKNRMEAIMSFSSENPLLHTPKALLGGLVAAIVGIPLVIGLLTPLNARAYPTDQNSDQSAKGSKAQEPITCASGSVRYPEGTVIQEGDGPEQMCARILDPANPKYPEAPPTYSPQWIYTNKVIRKRSAAIIHIPDGPPVYCSPGPAAEFGRCTCQAEGEFSQGARVNSAIGPFVLRCDHGTWAQTKTPNVKPR